MSVCLFNNNRVCPSICLFSVLPLSLCLSIDLFIVYPLSFSSFFFRFFFSLASLHLICLSFFCLSNVFLLPYFSLFFFFSNMQIFSLFHLSFCLLSNLSPCLSHVFLLSIFCLSQVFLSSIFCLSTVYITNPFHYQFRRRLRQVVLLAVVLGRDPDVVEGHDSARGLVVPLAHVRVHPSNVLLQKETFEIDEISLDSGKIRVEPILLFFNQEWKRTLRISSSRTKKMDSNYSFKYF